MVSIFNWDESIRLEPFENIDKYFSFKFINVYEEFDENGIII